VIRGAHLARSIIEHICLEGLDRIFTETVNLWTEGIKAVLFLRVRPHGLSVAQKYGHLKMLPLMRF
jgi:hypothetical protein